MRSTAIEGNIGCASTAWPVSGSVTMAFGGLAWGSTSGFCTSAAIGADQVGPWSVDRSRVSTPGWLFVNCPSVNASIRVPSGRTTIWFPQLKSLLGRRVDGLFGLPRLAAVGRAGEHRLRAVSLQGG